MKKDTNTDLRSQNTKLEGMLEQMRLPFIEEQVIYVDDLDYTLEQLDTREAYRAFINTYHLQARKIR